MWLAELLCRQATPLSQRSLRVEETKATLSVKGQSVAQPCEHALRPLTIPATYLKMVVFRRAPVGRQGKQSLRRLSRLAADGSSMSRLTLRDCCQDIAQSTHEATEHRLSPGVFFEQSPASLRFVRHNVVVSGSTKLCVSLSIQQCRFVA